MLNHLYDFLGGKTMNEFFGIFGPDKELQAPGAKTPTPGTE